MICQAVFLLATAAPAEPPRQITFSGYRWKVEDSGAEVVGPGPNYFSASEKSVEVDSQGHLHLRIAPRERGWACAAVTLDRSLGYGTYRFRVAPIGKPLDPHVVVGMFTYGHREDQAHREIDVELSHWADSKLPNAQFVVQPYERPDHLDRFEAPLDQVTEYEFRWSPGHVNFAARDATSKLIRRKEMSEAIPTPGDELPMLNLWLFEGRPPKLGKPIEVVFQRFEFAGLSKG